MPRADNLTTFMCRLSWNLGASTSWNPQGLSRPVMGLLNLFTLTTRTLVNKIMSCFIAKIKHSFEVTNNICRLQINDHKLNVERCFWFPRIYSVAKIPPIFRAHVSFTYTPCWICLTRFILRITEKKGDALSPLLFSFNLEYVITGLRQIRSPWK